MKPCLIGLVGILTLTWLAPTIHAAGLPDRVRASERVLVLNGSGARCKCFIKLYQAGLYLTDESSDATTVIAADVPMVIKIQITSVFVSQDKLVAALNDGFQKSTNGNLEPIRNEVRQFRQCFANSINKGDVFDIVYIPSSGLVVRKNGRQKGIIKGLPTKKAVFGIWLSNDPIDMRLKRALLGI